MEESQRSYSPPPCPSTVTVRRNPPRKARTTAAKPPSASLTSANTHDVPSFPIDEILSIQMPQPEPKPSAVSESLKIFLRIKPLRIFTKATTTKSRPRNVWPQNPSKRNSERESRNPENRKNKKSEEACITLNDPYSVTLTPPQALQELKRSKTEVYEGFSHVFPADCSQNDVYDKMVQPLLEDFMKGKSGMLAALGPSGSGKTHTVFGTPKDPGIVPLTLRQIFMKGDETSPVSLRSFYLSVFEICSERGKGEKAYDLLGDGSSELSVQQSTIRGLKEVPIETLGEAESLIGQAMLKRATATTNSNSQSSRSQCIINIRAAYDGDSNETKLQSSDAMLTIVDLAGAEREKRTGNQGERLVESNFINNTSMVFGQCLRSLLEYQKNRKKGLQKHHQNSLLTRYLRDYLEGKKRMALILTVKAGEEDYLDTTYLLKQASPYMKIKFDNTEEPCNKRQLKTFPRVEKNKKIKLSAPKTSQIEETVAAERNQISQEVNLKGNKAGQTEISSPRLEHVAQDNNEREHIIMRNFAKVLWNVLKQYNEKLKVAEGDICSLKESLRSEQLKSRGLETELINLKSSCLVSESNLAEPCIPKAEALVHAKEQCEVKFAETSDQEKSESTQGREVEIPAREAEEQCEVDTKEQCEVKFGETSDQEKSESTQGREVEILAREAEEQCDVEALVHAKEQCEVNFAETSDQEKSESTQCREVEIPARVAEEQCEVDTKEQCEIKFAETSDQEKSESTQGREVEIPAREAEPASTKKQRNGQKKPKRRLQPASSVLLTREINTLEIEDDVAEPKGTRGRKKTTVAQPRSQGSVTLLRLLTNNLHL